MNLLVYFGYTILAWWLILARELGSYSEQHYFEWEDSAQSQITHPKTVWVSVKSSVPNCFRQVATTSIVHPQISSYLPFR
jgi:hypothetical protein